MLLNKKEKSGGNKMKNRKLIAGLISIVALIFILVGCGGAEDNGDNQTDNQEADSIGNLAVEVIAKGFTQQYWTAVQSGAQEAADEFGVNLNFVGPANETAVQEQVQMLSNAVNKNPDAIVLASLDTSSQMDLLLQAQNNEIPIVGFDSGVPEAPEGVVPATAATNNRTAAGIAAENIFEAAEENLSTASVDNKSRIGVLAQEANSTSIVERTEGFIETMTELASQLDNIGEQIAVVGHQRFSNEVNENDASLVIQVQIPANATDSEVLTSAQALLNMDGLVGVFASNETASTGLLNAHEALGGVLGEDGIIAAGFDSGTLQKQAVSNETFIGSVTQDPITIGYDGVRLAVAAANGEEVEDLDVSAEWYNAENMESEEIAPLLYD